MDDLVVYESGETLRRSRGYVPDALTLPPGFKNIPPVLCPGTNLRNTFCLVRGERTVLSQRLGDLSDDGIRMQWREALCLMQNIYDFAPQYIMHDAHPGYVSNQWAHEMNLPTQAVLYYHAHTTACLVEHQWPLDSGDIIALTLDGIGMGGNSALWGGKYLWINCRECERPGDLSVVASPGGDLAAKQLWRNLSTWYLRFVPERQSYSETANVQQQSWSVLAWAIEHGINTPLVSSYGHFFDTVTVVLGCAPATLNYEGEAACTLKMPAAPYHGVAHPVAMSRVDDQLDLVTSWQQWPNWQAPVNQRAWTFYGALAQGLAALMYGQAMTRGITTLVFSDGIIHSRSLRTRLAHYLASFVLSFPQSLPVGDSGLFLGQGVIAATR